MGPTPGHATHARLPLERPMSSMLILDWRAWPTNNYIKTPEPFSEEAAEKHTNHEIDAELQRLEGEHWRSRTRSHLHPLQHHQHRHHDEEGVVHLWTMDLWQ
jgi:hypothetical protein